MRTIISTLFLVQKWNSGAAIGQKAQSDDTTTLISVFSHNQSIVVVGDSHGSALNITLRIPRYMTYSSSLLFPTQHKYEHSLDVGEKDTRPSTRHGRPD